MRFLLYSHDGLGLGHTRRHLAIARALSEIAPSASILLTTGTDDVNRLGLPADVEILKLPGLRKVQNGEYASRRLRISSSEIRELRSALLVTTMKKFRPSVLLVDRHPFGAKGELRDALQEHRQRGGRAVLGFRDILDSRAAILAEWNPENMQQQIVENYDELLIFGSEAILDPRTEYEFNARMAARTSFCGYIVNKSDAPQTNNNQGHSIFQKNGKPVVLATAGGGEDGYVLLETFLRAAANAPWQGVIVTGPMLAEEKINALKQSAAQANVPIKMFVPNLSDCFDKIDALVCMGGYNTLTEAVVKGVPTVCVPRTVPRTEQLLRAIAFEKLGLLQTVLPENLTSENLRDAVQKSLDSSRNTLLERAAEKIEFNGAHQAAVRLVALAEKAEHFRPLPKLAA